GGSGETTGGGEERQDGHCVCKVFGAHMLSLDLNEFARPMRLRCRTGEATGWRFLGIGAARLARRAVRREREVPWVGGGVGRPLRGTALERRVVASGPRRSRTATRPGAGRQ